jgi:5'/3'-nucleotidase SurE
MHLPQLPLPLPLLLSTLPLQLPTLSSPANIILSNDDGWAELNIRLFYSALTALNNSVVISAPADNESGTGSADLPATRRLTPCEFNSCPAGSPAEGFNQSERRWNYVNSWVLIWIPFWNTLIWYLRYPVTSMRYGIQTLSPKFFGGPPDIAVAGFNVGSNLGTTVLFSGTVGAATEAVKEGIPAIAFSGRTGKQTAWNAGVENYATVWVLASCWLVVRISLMFGCWSYADLSARVTQTLLDAGKPYLPDDIWLNVNFPAISATTCTAPSDFKFVLSRIYTAVQGITADDVITCENSGR